MRKVLRGDDLEPGQSVVFRFPFNRVATNPEVMNRFLLPK